MITLVQEMNWQKTEEEKIFVKGDDSRVSFPLLRARELSEYFRRNWNIKETHHRLPFSDCTLASISKYLYTGKLTVVNDDDACESTIALIYALDYLCFPSRLIRQCTDFDRLRWYHLMKLPSHCIQGRDLVFAAQHPELCRGRMMMMTIPRPLHHATIYEPEKLADWMKHTNTNSNACYMGLYWSVIGKREERKIVAFDPIFGKQMDVRCHRDDKLYLWCIGVVDGLLCGYEVYDYDVERIDGRLWVTYGKSRWIFYEITVVEDHPHAPCYSLMNGTSFHEYEGPRRKTVNVRSEDAAVPGGDV